MDFQVANQPVWVMNLERKQWSMLPARHPSGHGQYLAPAVYDSARKEIVTWSEGGIRVIAGERNKVECLGGQTAMAIGTAAYDAKNRTVVFYGRYGGSDEVTVYDHSSGKNWSRRCRPPTRARRRHGDAPWHTIPARGGRYCASRVSARGQSKPGFTT
jgi:hypothetical protein